MKILFILEAQFRDKINRVRKNEIVGVYSDLSKLEEAKNKVLCLPHDYTSVSFSINTEIQPFYA